MRAAVLFALCHIPAMSEHRLPVVIGKITAQSFIELRHLDLLFPESKKLFVSTADKLHEFNTAVRSVDRRYIRISNSNKAGNTALLMKVYARCLPCIEVLVRIEALAMLKGKPCDLLQYTAYAAKLPFLIGG